MFTQFRNVVGQLAQETTRALENAALADSQSEAHSRSQSVDTQPSASAPSSSQLADSALSSLRKSLAAQRAGTSSPAARRSASPAPTEKRLPKSNLEERLRRATTGIVESPGSSTPNRSPPNRSSAASPAPISKHPVNRHKKSPSSTPLPASPAVIAVTENDSKLAPPTELSLQELPVTSKVQPPKEPKEEETIDNPDPSPLDEDPTPVPVEGTPPKDKEDGIGVVNGDNSNPTSLVEESPAASEAESPKDQDDHVVVEREIAVDISPPPTEVERVDQVEECPSVVAEVVPESIPPVEVAVAIHASEPTSSDEAKVREAPVSSPKAVSVVDHSAEVDSLQERLRQVEQRFSDVSTSFKRLQAERLAADAVLQETSPLESIQNTAALRKFFTNIKTKEQVFQDELKRLNEKLESQENRFDELQGAHRLELNFRSEEIQKLRTQMAETEALFDAAQRATSNAEDVVNKHREEISQLQKDVEDVKNLAKEEEEKRVKAISLLKTVRQKLVKAEKDREDAVKEANSLRNREKGDKDKEQAEKLNFHYEMESLTATHDKAIAALRSQFEKDIAAMRERYEQEIGALRGQSELDLASIKSSSSKELSAKCSQITSLENSLNNATRDKNAFFDQLQLRQAEVESAQAHLESLEHQNTELQFQLRESNDRIALLREECAELAREQENRVRDPVTSADEVARMVSATEAKYEAKLVELKRNLVVMEKERYESEADWSRKLKEKVKDLEDLKRVLGSATKTRENDENFVAELKAQLSETQDTIRTLQRQNSELPLLRDQIQELEKSSRDQTGEASVKILVLEKQVEETKNRELQTRQANKTIREELRKVQSSAALLERQRNPGVGYWTTRKSESSAPSEPRTSISLPTPDTPTRVSSPTPSTTPSNQNEEEVNLEYLRNVILQFLEHKEMRPNLVKVLSIILHFTPQETRRLIAKV